MKLPPLAIGALAGLVLAAALAPATGTALGNLASARAERARLTAEIAAPATGGTPLVAPDLALQGGGDVLVARIRERARGGGVLIEEATPLKTEGSLVMIRFRASGPEKAVIALADALERETPLVRLRTWKLIAIPGGVRLIGDAVAVVR